MHMVSLQIQSVLYHNEKDGLVRALEGILNALRVDGMVDGSCISELVVSYGDASEEPLFSNEEIRDLSERFSDNFKLRYRFFGENTGTAKGHNLLGADCASDFMMIMNPDVLLSPSFFKEIMTPFFNMPECVGITEGRQVPIEHPKEYDSATGETSWASTAAAVFGTKDFREIGGFDSDSFFMYCDDLDFSWRIKQLGKKIIYRPSAPVFHAKQLSVSGAWCPTAAEVYYSAEASIMMAYKWSQDARCANIINSFLHSPDLVYQKAAKAFLKRKDAGLLPQQIDASHEVATFVGDNYAEHRFAL